MSRPGTGPAVGRALAGALAAGFILLGRTARGEDSGLGAGQALDLMGSARSAALAADTAAGEGVSGLAVNPAALAGQQRPAGAGTMVGGLGGARVGQVAAAVPTPAGTLAFGLGAADAGDIELDDASGNSRTVPAQRDVLATVGFGRRLAAGVEAGVAVTSYRSTLAGTYSARTVAGDAGIRWTSGDGAVALGLVLARYGRGLAYAGERVALARTTRLGAAWRPVQGRALAVVLATDYGAAAFGPDTLGAGAELVGLGVLALRAGVSVLGGVATAGAGMGLALGRLRFDYALAAPARVAPVSRATLTVAL